MLLVTSCSKDTYPSFINLPSGVEQLQRNETTTTTIQDLNVYAEKPCVLENYRALNKLCGFPNFWNDFSNFMQKWVTYKVLLAIIAVIFGWLLLKKFVWS